MAVGSRAASPEQTTDPSTAKPKHLDHNGHSTTHPWRSKRVPHPTNGHAPNLFKHPLQKYIRELEPTSDASCPACLRCNFRAGVSSYCAECVKPRVRSSYKMAEVKPWFTGERDPIEAARLARALKLAANANGN